MRESEPGPEPEQPSMFAVIVAGQLHVIGTCYIGYMSLFLYGSDRSNPTDV